MCWVLPAPAGRLSGLPAPSSPIFTGVLQRQAAHAGCIRCVHQREPLTMQDVLVLYLASLARVQSSGPALGPYPFVASSLLLGCPAYAQLPLPAQ